jgi:hypothetical protein
MIAKTELSAPKRRTRAEVQQLVAEFVSSGMRQSEAHLFRITGDAEVSTDFVATSDLPTNCQQ